MMETQLCDVQSLVQRLTRLENENRRFKRGAAALAVIVSALVLMGQAQSHHTVEAERFVLKDQGGKIRAEVKVDDYKRPGLHFYDEDGAATTFFDINDLTIMQRDNYTSIQPGELLIHNQQGKIEFQEN